MLAGLAEAELAEQRGELAGLGLVDGEFDEADAAALRLRRQPAADALSGIGASWSSSRISERRPSTAVRTAEPARNWSLKISSDSGPA